MGIRSLSAASISTGAKRSKFWDQSAILFTSDYETIASQVLTSTTGQITFDSIPSTYRHLQFRISASAATDTQLDVTFNNDSGSNYWTGGFVSTGIGNFPEVVGNRSTMIWEGLSSVTNVFTGYVVDIIDYKETSKNKQVRIFSGYQDNTAARFSIFSNVWQSTNAINRIDLFARSSTFKVGSVFSLYGIKGA